MRTKPVALAIMVLALGGVISAASAETIAELF